MPRSASASTHSSHTGSSAALADQCWRGGADRWSPAHQRASGALNGHIQTALERCCFALRLTDEPGALSQLLKLTAELPEVLTFTPRDLSWVAGEKPEAKSVDVLVNVPGGVELAAAWANQPDFKVELVTVAPRTHYRVKVTPPAGAKPQQAVILLRAADPVPAGTALTFYARVK